MRSTANEASKRVLTARAEASAWITRLHGPNRSAEMEEGLRRWLSERPENAQEFEGLTEVWDLVAASVPIRVPRLERWEQSAEARELYELRERFKGRASSSPMPWAVAAAALLVCGLIAWQYWPTTSYATGIGEQRVIQLEDGSVVSLNSGSELSVQYHSNSRSVRLNHGEALFRVAKDAKRPFIVSAGDSRVTALGTSFIVQQENDRTAITLVEGKVSVLAPQRLKREANDARIAYQRPNEIVLSPGQRLTLPTSDAAALDTPQLDRITAWRRGEVVLADTPLAEAVKEMNRYDKTRIVLDSPDIEALTVSGLYHTGDSEGFARSVVQMYKLTLTERDGQIHLAR